MKTFSQLILSRIVDDPSDKRGTTEMDSYHKRTYLLPFNRETRRNVTVDSVEGLTAAVSLG